MNELLKFDEYTYVATIGATVWAANDAISVRECACIINVDSELRKSKNRTSPPIDPATIFID